MPAKHLPIEEFDCFMQFESVAHWVWTTVQTWDWVAKRTVGIQLIEAADSIGANMVEGDGRYGRRDSVRMFYIARGSARETRLWLERAKLRGLISVADCEQQLQQLVVATKALNKLIEYQRGFADTRGVREHRSEYGDPLFSDELPNADEITEHEFDDGRAPNNQDLRPRT
jgi:four helix bundle protein